MIFAGIKRAIATRVLNEVSEAVRSWRSHAEAAEMPQNDVERIEKTFRRELLNG